MTGADGHWRADGTWSYFQAALWIVLSFAFFRLCQHLVTYYIFGELSLGDFSLFGCKRELANADYEEEELPARTRWRITNEVVSGLHAAICGFWASYALLLNRELVYDMEFTNNVCIYLLFVTAGYLIHDFLDLIMHEGSCRIMELLYHHVIVLAGFMVPLVFEKYMGIVMLGLLMEVNSVALHVRSLCNLYRVSKQSLAFRGLAMVNLITMVLFRMAVSGYLCYWLITMFTEVEIWKWLIFFVVTVSLSISNLILFYRLMQADGFFGKRPARKLVRDVTKRSSHSDESEENSDAIV